jgi:hypothetical protein
VILTRLGSLGLTPLLKLGASSESRRNIESKTVRSIKAEKEDWNVQLRYECHTGYRCLEGWSKK